MFGKFLLIALLCVSVAQVHGDELENIKLNGLRRVKAMNENGLNRYDAAVQDADFKSQLVDTKTYQFIEKGNRMQMNSRQSLSNIATLIRRKATENNRPESVFQCVTMNEDKGNTEIDTYTRKFAVDMERLRGTKQENIDTAARTFDDMEDALEVRYQKAVRDIQNCQNTICVNTVVSGFSTYMNTMYATIRRVEGQITTVLANFQRDATTFFTNTNRQVTRIRSSTVTNIKNCYFRGENDFQES